MLQETGSTIELTSNLQSYVEIKSDIVEGDEQKIVDDEEKNSQSQTRQKMQST